MSASLRKPTSIMAVVLVLAVAATLSGVVGCGGNGEGAGEDKLDSATQESFSVNSADFNDSGELPSASGCDSQGGDNLSPQLSWQGAPAETTAYAVIMDDEDPPCGAGVDACRHWAVLNIPASVTSLSRGVDISTIAGASGGENYQGVSGYASPCPPNRHTYKITVFALGRGMPVIPAGIPMTRSGFKSMYRDFILAQDTISGSFGS